MTPTRTHIAVQKENKRRIKEKAKKEKLAEI
jgi:hypothetical protein